jgi:cbb3-type cytochrome oxidase subunit 3
VTPITSWFVLAGLILFVVLVLVWAFRDSKM